MTIARFRDLLSKVTYPGHTFEVSKEAANYFLRVASPEGLCTVTNVPNPWKGRKHRLSTHMTDGEVVQTALMAVLQAQEHETRERFLFMGRPVFGPHFDIHTLVALCGTPGGGLKERPQPFVAERRPDPQTCLHKTIHRLAGACLCADCGTPL